MASDKALALQLCRKEFAQRWKTMKHIFIKREKGTVCGHTLEDSERATPSWWFESLSWGRSSKFPLADHFALPVSELAFGFSQDSRICAHISHQVGFQWRGLWVDSPLDLLSDFLVGNVSLTWEHEKYVASYLGRIQPILLIVLLLILIFWSSCPQEMSPGCFSCGGGRVSISCLNSTKKEHQKKLWIYTT